MREPKPKSGRPMGPKDKSKLFKKGGKPGNPGGRPKDSEALKDAKRIMLERYPEFVVEMFTSPYTHQLAKLKAAEGTAAEMLFRSSVLTAIKKGDFDVLVKIMNRIIGNGPMLPLQLEGIDGIIAGLANATPTDQAPRIIVNLPSNGR